MKNIIFLVLLFCMPFVSAATLHGNIYDMDFEIVENSIVRIDSVPKQSMIASDGSYSFELNPGYYNLDAKYYIGESLVSSTSEKVNIIEGGDYVLDLILFPNLDENIDENLEVDFFNTGFGAGYLVLILTVLLFVFFYLIKRDNKKSSDEGDMARILKFIKKEGGRTTQKEIRKAFSLSEAKASLVITELEHKRLVKRIRKGRGNVIILNNH